MSAKWICYPHDFELYLFNSLMTKRYERDVMVPPFWRMDGHYRTIKFSNNVNISKDIKVKVKFSKGTIANISLDDTGYIYDFKDEFILSKGKHNLLITLYNVENLPAMYLESEELVSDDSWIVTSNDHVFKNAYILPCAPEKYHLPTRKINYSSKEVVDDKILYDLGKENMIFVKIKNASHKTRVYLGESRQEALDIDHCETLFDFSKENKMSKFSKACRYVCVKQEDNVELEFFEEYSKHNFYPIAAFEDKTLNDIYNVSLYTLHLNSREFFLDGIKRDRWIWGGDAFQSYLMSYYSFNDFETIKRTTIALLGKKPYMTHINHIMDYSLFFVKGIYDYLYHSGDFKFVKDIFDDLMDFMDFIVGRADDDGLLTGLPNDWVFVDWSSLDNKGQVCVEQILYYAALDSIYRLGELLDRSSEVKKYKELSNDVFNKIESFFNIDKKCYEYNIVNNEFVSQVRKHPNIFAILFDICDDDRKKLLIDNVLCNPNVLKITTPYMRFYELAALAKQGKYDYVIEEVKNYWGGMLNMNATTFWESYDLNEKEPECYSMYNRRYGKSLCHAWGANPIYLIGKYYIGLTPTSIGYETFEINPKLKYLGNFKLSFPINKGKLLIENNNGTLKIKYNFGKCLLKLNGKQIKLTKNKVNTIDAKEEC